jgi:uncharacterized membrane protein
MSFHELVENVGKGVDAAGVVLMIAGVLVATWLAAARRLGGDAGEDALRRYRRGIGAAILLGLEVLVAADIIRTVAVAPSFESAGVLAIIVVMRTFLSFSLEVELEGRWPWQRRPGPEAAGRYASAPASTDGPTGATRSPEA